MVSYDFSDRVVLVTGAARGQGRSHAVKFAHHGADLVIADLPGEHRKAPYALGTVEELKETRDLVVAEQADCRIVEMDIANEEDVQRGVDEAMATFGRIDVLANNAGVAPVGGIIETSGDAWDLAFDVNVKGTWLCAKHVGRAMIEQGNGGRIVNTSSTTGLSAAPGLGAYSTSKHGVIALTKALAVELAPHGVTVNAVCPTTVDTPMTQGILQALDDDLAELAERAGPENLLGEIVEPEDVSEAFLWLSSDAARFVTGIALPVAGGSTAL